ncbi:response regulator transcription factor [Pelotomaculum propionicicum]|uniref:Stage 0 sporulation protein A homolog n=1 Tax=Pelotomaculum propionicicum TaxID=258475 RepID=A0A4Y7RQS5_9FIRM|nr:response regulator transcription factor [Peptococcaceae bacterium]TEB11354.1 Response regulator MprA [Pelotomaculum propionicicum]
MSKILVIDDDKRITALLRRSLVFEGYDVQAAGGGEEGLRLAASWQPDLVILDVLMPGLDGWEVCRRLRAVSDLPVLMLTARDEVADRVKGLDLGSDDYLVKPFALEELLARVRALLRRKKPGKEEMLPLSYDDLVLDYMTREVRRGDRPLYLTAKEFELLALFMEHPRQVLTRDLIMDRVWGADFLGESNVLEVYIGMLRQKLEESGGERLIKTVRGVGYVLKKETEFRIQKTE